jgi:hypothetical protein
MLCAAYVNCILMLENWLFELCELWFFLKGVNGKINCSRVSLLVYSQITYVTLKSQIKNVIIES